MLLKSLSWIFRSVEMCVNTCKFCETYFCVCDTHFRDLEGGENPYQENCDRMIDEFKSGSSFLTKFGFKQDYLIAKRDQIEFDEPGLLDRRILFRDIR